MSFSSVRMNIQLATRALSKLENVILALLPIGLMQNQTMEAVIDFDGKIKHEKNCLFITCSCPLFDCNGNGSSEMIYAHCKVMHKDSVTPFYFGRKSVVSLKLNDKFFILQKKKSDIVFYKNNTLSCYGNIITLCCLGTLPNGWCPYDIEVKFNDSSSHKFHSSTKNIQHTDIYYRSLTGFLLDSEHECFANGLIKMEICVRPSWELGSNDDL
ncbi:E3 ubiquitin-protein ligase SINA-like 10 [Mercurialis annua]|uniref:E3 ubiquitin-protein ligase SINA-like 10 n=1 Tax=Mercurialis annua TaxID=3986 RepID=UPI00215F8D25|nr:E3 ubiquitin-protein ligase SINA-like 10 [Mercurialis annua]